MDRKIRAAGVPFSGPARLGHESHDFRCVFVVFRGPYRCTHSPACGRYRYARGALIGRARFRTLTEYEVRCAVPAWAAGPGAPP